MADRKLDEYESLNFYAKNTKPKKSGFSKFQVEDKYYFCRYVDGDIAMISQAYTGKPGRDNGIESVKKNEKIASRYKFDTRGKAGQGFGLRAGNGQEIAISPNYSSLAKAQSVASRMSGASFTSSGKTASKKKLPAKKAATKNLVAKKALAKKSRVRKAPIKKATRFTEKDSRVENYKALSFYQRNGSLRKGFNSFDKNGAYYFHYVEDGKIVLISESYTSKRGRDNGISSVMKNMGLKSAYQYHQHKNGKFYFDINATNGQEIATSRWYSSKGAARDGAAYLTGDKTRLGAASTKKPRATTAKAKTAKTAKGAKAAKPAKVSQTKSVRSRSDEDNYPPLAFYRKQTKGKKKGFEKFKGNDGEYYFAYFDNSKMALISEGYPTATIRDKGVASVEKNIKIEKRYVQGTGADGKPGFILRAGNHKEIARSVGYGSAAAAVAGAAYLMGTRRRPAAKPKAVKPKVAAVKKAPAPVPAKPASKAKAPVKKVIPKKPPVKRTSKIKAKPLAAGTVAAAGLGAASLAAAKTSEVRKAAVPVKAAPIKAVAPPPPPAPVPTPVQAAPVAAAPIKAAAAAPVAAAAAAAAIPAGAPAAAGAWGWLKWLLLALLALLAALFLFKSCVGGADDAKLVTPVTTQSAAPAAMVDCWNGTSAKNEAACPAKVSCWDDSFATSLSACPARPVERNFDCWDGSKAVDLAGCPLKPEPKVAVAAKAPVVQKMTPPSVSGRICGPSSNPLFDAAGITPITVTRLGTNPQFGNSLGLSSDAFFARLQSRYRSNANDRAFLNLLARSLGHGSFQNMDASMFSEDTLANGTSGVLGLGQQHAVQFSKLNMTDPTHLEAFKVRSANGTDVHFMKRCGNFMYVCQP